MNFSQSFCCLNFSKFQAPSLNDITPPPQTQTPTNPALQSNDKLTKHNRICFQLIVGFQFA